MVLISQNIRTVRKDNKLTQKKLSEKSGVAYATLDKYENTGIISIESLIKICNALDSLKEFESILIPEDLRRKESLFDF